jgi:nitrite reductase/ring-hydroxylating ferredoxin subunit/uncharacterized membrane protein
MEVRMIASFIDRLVRSQRWLDPFGEFVQKVVGGIYKPLGRPGQALKSFLHGTWFGHALHPVIVSVPLGAWTAAFVADLVAYTGRLRPEVGDFCVLIGVLASYGALVTGYTDFHETSGHERKVGAAHGLIMTTTILLYSASWLLRWLVGGSVHDLAVALAVIGYLLVISGAYFGGDLVFRIGTMVNRNAFIEAPKNFVRVGRPQDFAEGQMKRVEAGGMPVLILRHKGRLHAISNICAHAGGPLDEGELNGTVVTCPWHASQFDITTGLVKRGPATFAQPALSVRENDNAVEVKQGRSLYA